MSRTLGHLKWWQWAFVVLWGGSALRQVGVSSTGELVGAAVGALGGAYLIVLLVVMTYRRVTGDEQPAAEKTAA